MKDKRQLFLNIWNKKNSPVRDRIKSKLEVRGIEPSELNCYEYWMGYIKPWADVRGNITSGGTERMEIRSIWNTSTWSLPTLLSIS